MAKPTIEEEEAGPDQNEMDEHIEPETTQMEQKDVTSNKKSENISEEVQMIVPEIGTPQQLTRA